MNSACFSLSFPVSLCLSAPVCSVGSDLFALIRAEGQQQHSEWQCGRTAQMLVGKVQLLPPFIAFSVRLAAESQGPAHAF